MKSVEEMMLPPPPSSPFFQRAEDKRRVDSLTSSSPGLRSPFRDSLASKERRYQQERQRVSRSTDYKAELGRLLSKAKGTPYEETLQQLIEGKRGSSRINMSRSLVDTGSEYKSMQARVTPGLPPRSPPRVSQASSQSRMTELDRNAEDVAVPVVAQASPTREMAKSVLRTIASRRDEIVDDTEKLKEEATSIRSRRSDDRQKWLRDIAKPKDRYGWSFESEYRKKNSLIKTTTNHLGRQRPPPDVRSVDMVAHTARGNVNLFDYHESMKDFVKLGAVNSEMYDPNQHLVQNLAKEKKVITTGQFQAWLDDTRRWREGITEKAELKLKEQTPEFAPVMFTKDKDIIRRARERESQHIEEELLEMSTGLGGSRSTSQSRARSASPSFRGEGSGGSTGADGGELSASEIRRRQDELRSQRERLMAERPGEEHEEGPEEDVDQGNDDGSSPAVSPPSLQGEDTSSLVYSSPDTRDAFEQEDDDKRHYYREVAEKVAKTPDVFKRMSARIVAYNQRAYAEKELQEAVEKDIQNSVHNSRERMRLLSLRERRRRSKSPTLTDSRRERFGARVGAGGISFTPEMNKKSAIIVKRMQREGSWTPISERRSRRSSSLPPRVDKTSQTAQERVLSFLDSVGGSSPSPSPRPSIQMPGSAAGSSNQQEGNEGESPRGRPQRRKTFVFEKSMRSGSAEMRSTSLPPPPDRPRFGVRSVSSEAVIDRYDTIDTKARRAVKREQRVMETYERSKSPKLIGSRVNINSRRYTMASPPKRSRFANNPGKFTDKANSKIDGITRRLSVLYERRSNLESGGDTESVFSRSRAGDSSDEEDGKVRVGRRKSVTHSMNQKHLARSRFRGQSFEERVEASVDEYIVRRGVSDTLALNGASPGPGHYNVSGDTKSYFSNCNKIVGGDAVEYRTTAGKYGYKFGNRSMRKMSYYGPVEVKGVAYKLTDADDVVGLPSEKSSGDRLPDRIHQENAPRPFSPSRSGSQISSISEGGEA